MPSPTAEKNREYARAYYARNRHWLKLTWGDKGRSGQQYEEIQPGPSTIYAGIKAPNFLFALQDTLRFVRHL